MTVGKTSVLVLDCAEPLELAGFYAALLDAETRVGNDPDFVEVVGNSGVHLAIRRDHGYAPPSWPRPEDAQQAHLRILVERGAMDEAEREAVSLGARPVDTGDTTIGSHDVRVYADPAGHSFSLAARR
ncbi:VOC family protein [Streptomyces halstedii]|uniref:VOC family protein n=1 Tax=Streptomyces TaxID=1883 RepID=UPI0004A99C6B|nr:VOC family protein [Streptomyces sp. NTK 937]KDQ70446.1 extradiol dioxygenase [Streptomyces sp. NTK 937]WSX35132.1 VOC family protein [Streptomyces halstedii]